MLTRVSMFLLSWAKRNTGQHDITVFNLLSGSSRGQTARKSFGVIHTAVRSELTEIHPTHHSNEPAQPSPGETPSQHSQ